MMLIPIGERIRRQVRLIWSTPSPRVVAGSLVWFDGNVYRVALSQQESIRPGELVVLDLGGPGATRQRVKVDRVEGPVVTVSQAAPILPRERREWPRVSARMAVGVEELPSAWATDDVDLPAGALVPPPAAVVLSDQNVDISVSGLRFNSLQGYELGGLIVVRLVIPPATRPSSILAEVKRSQRKNDIQWSVALSFLDLSSATAEALQAFISRQQLQRLGLEDIDIPVDPEDDSDLD